MSNILRKFMDKSLSIGYMGVDWNNELTQNIIEAGRTISYVETLCNKADKLHLSIKQCDQRRLLHEFEKVVRFAVAKLKLKRVKIAFDVTEDKTWMKPTYSLRPSAYEDHAPSWQYLNVSIVYPYFIPLMSIPYRQIDNLDLLIIDLLKYIKNIEITVDLLLFDRGFYHSHLIDYLNGKKRGWSWPYLMLVPRNKKVKEYIEETDSFNFFDHKFNYKKEMNSWKTSTTIIVKRIDDKTCWCYATNLNPSLKLVMEYSKRWNIETGFRVHDEAKIKSKSKHPIVRLFYHLVGMLLIILWRLQNKIEYYVFKRFLKLIEYQFYPKEIKELLAPP
jgi:hypothetical protein